VHRFYAPAIGPAGSAAPLPPEEAQHLIRVLRLSIGETVRIFDGRGREHVATVEALTKSDAIVRIGEAATPAEEPFVTITLAMALLKADKFDEVVRDATMLGVRAIQPIATTRTDVPPSRTARVDRWRRIAVSSAKQCGRAVVPSIGEPITFSEFIAKPIAERLLMLAEPGLQGVISTRQLAAEPAPSSAALLVGPEGGWADAEHRLALECNATLVTLGPRTLRAESAPLVALAVLQHIWGDTAALNAAPDRS
jgi:16S rRNA (uracil1498-N3)-methyltransferase